MNESEDFIKQITSLNEKYKSYYEEYNFEEALECEENMFELVYYYTFIRKLKCLIGLQKPYRVIELGNNYLSEGDKPKNKKAEVKLCMGIAKKNILLGLKDDLEKEKLLVEFLDCMHYYQRNGNPDKNVDYLNEMAWFYQRMGNKEEREEFIENSLKINPTNFSTILLKEDFLLSDFGAEELEKFRKKYSRDIIKTIEKNERNYKNYLEKIAPKSSDSDIDLDIKKKKKRKDILDTRRVFEEKLGDFY